MNTYLVCTGTWNYRHHYVVQGVFGCNHQELPMALANVCGIQTIQIASVSWQPNKETAHDLGKTWRKSGLIPTN